MTFALTQLHMRYPVYLEETGEEERMLNYYWSIIHGLKEAYWQTPKDERPNFMRTPQEIQKTKINLNEMIEKSIQMQREKMAKKRAAEEASAQTAQNGTRHRRKRQQRYLQAVPIR